MSSLLLGRVVRQTCAATSSSSVLACAGRGSTASLAAVSARPLCRAARQHQRRQSSSKASVPPDGPRGSAPSSQQSSTSTGRVGRRKTKDTPVAPPNTRDQSFSKQYPNLPSVPPTSHLQPSDINVSSFFSCHRPISVTAVVPRPATDASFSTIFEPRTQNNKGRHQEVIFTLGSVVDSLESATEGSQDENSLQWQMAQENSEEGVKHVDGAPRDIPLDKLASQYRPFKPPPPPQPFEYAPKTVEKRSKKGKRASVAGRAQAVRPEKKSWSTTIIVTERTWPSGEKTYQATTSDIVRVPDPSENTTITDPESIHRAPIQQPFLRRMLIRRQRYGRRRARLLQDRKDRPNMILISVKRQRKLKMKKHKYKKLMRRTRNLRRRLRKI